MDGNFVAEGREREAIMGNARESTINQGLNFASGDWGSVPFKMDGPTFRASRETIGLSQHSVADAIGVSVGRVAKWERGREAVPEEAGRWMSSRMAKYDWMVSKILDAFGDAIDIVEEMSGSEIQDLSCPPIVLDYWRSQGECDSFGFGEDDYMTINACYRTVATALRSYGIDVFFKYPTHGEGER